VSNSEFYYHHIEETQVKYIAAYSRESGTEILASYTCWVYKHIGQCRLFLLLFAL